MYVQRRYNSNRTASWCELLSRVFWHCTCMWHLAGATNYDRPFCCTTILIQSISVEHSRIAVRTLCWRLRRWVSTKSLVSQPSSLNGKWLWRVYPRVLKPNGGAGKSRPRNALPRAPACFKSNSDALARCPQPMPSTRNFVLSGRLLGRTLQPRTRGQNGSPFWLYIGVVCPRNFTTIYVLPRRDHNFSPLDWNHTPWRPLTTDPIVGANTSTRHRTTARTVQRLNNPQLRVVVIDFFWK